MQPSSIDSPFAQAPDSRAHLMRLLELECSLHEEVDLRYFTGKANPLFRWHRHNLLLSDVLEQIVAGKIFRLLVLEPPRHGKSEQTSRIFPGYYLYKFPERWVGLTSYAADLAYGFSRAARANYQALGRPLKGKEGVELWETGAGGGLWASGVGGPITGKGFHLGVIDDPLKNAEEASSAAIRRKQIEWYQSTFYTRQEPGAAIVVIMTRWNTGDLVGWLLQQETEAEELGQEPEHWHILNLPAIRDEHYYSFPATCTVIPDWRERGSGEPLCPERYPLAKLKKLMSKVGSYYAEALYQQRPSATVGKGRVYYAFDGWNISDEVKLYQPPRRIGRNWVGDTEIHVGMDFNVDPMSAAVCRRVANQLHQFDEIEIFDAGTEVMCQEIERRYPGSHIIVYPDPSGKARKTSAPVGQTDFTIIRAKPPRGHGFTLVADGSAPPQVDRYNSVNVLCGEQGATPRYYVHPRCKRTIECLQTLIYKPGTGVPDTSSGLDHMPAGLGYLIWQLFPVRAGEGVETLRLPR